MSSTEHEHSNAAYERKDVNFGCILALIIVTGCTFAVMFALDWYFFHTERQIQSESKNSPYTRSSAGPPSLPPPPRLDQIDRMEMPPQKNYSARVAEMVRQLHSSGPTTEKGFVHIPIEQAMKDIVKQLPVRKQPSNEALRPIHPGSSNSGRMLPGAPPWTEF